MKTLNKVKIEGFKSIRSQELKLTDLNIIIGGNGTGKSNLIGAFRLLSTVVDRSLQLYVASEPDRILHHGQKHTQVVKFHFEFDQNSYGFSLMPSNDTLIFSAEDVEYHGRFSFSQTIGSGHKESKLEQAAKEWTNKAPEYIFPLVKKLRVYHFHDTSSSSPAKLTNDINDNQQFKPDGGNLASFLYMLKSNHAICYQQIVEHIQMVAPYFEDFLLEPMVLNPDKIKLVWKQKGSDAYFDAFSLSDGTLRFICLCTLLLQPAPPALILLDEPELGLHPSAICNVAEMLEAAAKRTQVLVATQSVTLLNYFTPEQVIVAEHNGSESFFKRFEVSELQQWLDDYSLGELWEKNVFGGRP